jgi:hypothetical protein
LQAKKLKQPKMVAFCDEIVSEIKAAANDAQVRDVVTDSVTRFRMKSNRNVANYLTYVIVTLQAAKGDELPSEIVNKINTAVDLFRDYRSRNPEYFF